MNRLITIGLLFTFLGFFYAEEVAGQFVEFQPLPVNKFKKQVEAPNQRLQSKLLLPIWDDFSLGMDTTLWDFEGATFSETIGINPPSIGVLVLNGVDQNGKPYSLQPKDQGESDYLTSKSIDLTSLSSNQKNSLFLSFFWQSGGKSEGPDTSDKLTLQYLDEDGVWNTIWTKNGGPDLNRETFFQELIQIQPEWQHADFKFRFYSSGRQSGPFDSWLIDYVYLNTNRTGEDRFFRDRALTQPNHISLGEYAAYPWFLLDEFQEGNWSKVSNEFNNLENRFRAMEFSISAQDEVGGNKLSINLNTPFDPVPNSLERRPFEGRSFDKIPSPQEETDYFFETYITTGDLRLFELVDGDTLWYDQVDFAQNDTVRTNFPLRDYFAYDGGTPDYAAGINQRSGQLAVKYSSPKEVFLKGISIQFTNPNQANQALDLVVWKSLDQRPVVTQQIVIPPFESGSEFMYFPLDTNLRISGEFYIGFTQFTNDFIHVGLDKTRDQADKIFYNVGAGWVANEEVKGSLLIRPHVSSTPPFEESSLPESSFRIYPNPVINELHIEGKHDTVHVFDSFGREILLERRKTEKGEILNFEGQLSGVYVVHLISNQSTQSVRILVRN